MASSTVNRKTKVKTSILSPQIAGKGPEAFCDVEWSTLSDNEAKLLEKEESFAWQILSNSQMQRLMVLPVEELHKQLAEIMNLEDHALYLDQAALLDFYVSGFWWGKEQVWNEQQISGFFTVIYKLLEKLKDDKFLLKDNMTELRNMFVGIGTDGDQNGGLDFLDVKMATSIADFLSTVFFQHYSLYEFLFHGDRKEEITTTDLVVELIPPANLPHPPPLDEGLLEDLYQRHVAPPPIPESEDSDEPLKEITTSQGDEDKDDYADRKSKTENESSYESTSVETEIPSNVLLGVTADDVQSMFDSVSQELFSGLQSHIAVKLCAHESEIIARINNIHRISGT